MPRHFVAMHSQMLPRKHGVLQAIIHSANLCNVGQLESEVVHLKASQCETNQSCTVKEEAFWALSHDPRHAIMRIAYALK